MSEQDVAMRIAVASAFRDCGLPSDEQDVDDFLVALRSFGYVVERLERRSGDEQITANFSGSGLPRSRSGLASRALLVLAPPRLGDRANAERRLRAMSCDLVMARLVTTVDDVDGLLIGAMLSHHRIGSSCARLSHFAAVSPPERQADLRFIGLRLPNLALGTDRLSSVIRVDASEGGWLVR